MSMSLQMRAIQAILYAFGPFYAYPYKPLLNHSFGDSYEIGYKHFRRDHNTVLNQLAHLICLVLQVAGNFLFLHYLDAKIPSGWTGALPLISISTAIVWISVLVRGATGAPMIANALAVGSIVAALLSAPSLDPQTLEFGTIAAFLALFVAADLFDIRGRTHVSMSQTLPQIGGVFGVWLALWYGVNSQFAGILAHKTTEITVGLVVLLLLVSSLNNVS
jgi:hypothetical protein